MVTGISHVSELGGHVREIDAVGILAEGLGSPDSISLEEAREVARSLPEACKSVLITHVGIEEVEHLVKVVQPNMVQLDHPDIGAEDVVRIKQLVGVEVIKVFPMVEEEIDQFAQNIVNAGIPFLEKADTFAFDRWNARYGITYGQGRSPNWSVTRRIVAEFRRVHPPIQIMVGGGLTARNVRKVIRSIHPDWVDVSSGVKSDGRIDLAKLVSFIQAVRHH